MADNNCELTKVLLPNTGKYRLSEEIGSGAYGIVYKGLRKDDSKTIALKRIFITDKDGNNNIPLSTHRELFVLKRLNSFDNENIVKLYDVVLNRIDSKLCIDLIFELGDYDLEVYLKKFNSKGDMPVKKIMNLTRQLVDGIYFMHSYCIIHRDLKPANILINRDGTDLKITDFGLARILGFNASLTPVVVTLWYRSPEILLQQSYLTACDIWSAGCIFAEMFYGRPIFAGENEVSQIETIVNRLGSEAIENWPDNNIVDGRALERFVDNSCSLDSILKRADKLILVLVKKFLKFDPDKRISSCNALKELNRWEMIMAQPSYRGARISTPLTSTSVSTTTFDSPVQLNQHSLRLNKFNRISEVQTNRPFVPNPATMMVATRRQTKAFSTSKVPTSVSLGTVNNNIINCRFPTATGISSLGCVDNDCEIDAQNQIIVNSVVKNVLDEDVLNFGIENHCHLSYSNNILPLQSPNSQQQFLVNQNEDFEEKITGVVLDETESISTYPHEQVEIFSREEREEDNENEEREDSEEYYDYDGDDDQENDEIVQQNATVVMEELLSPELSLLMLLEEEASADPQRFLQIRNHLNNNDCHIQEEESIRTTSVIGEISNHSSPNSFDTESCSEGRDDDNDHEYIENHSSDVTNPAAIAIAPGGFLNNQSVIIDDIQSNFNSYRTRFNNEHSITSSYGEPKSPCTDTSQYSASSSSVDDESKAIAMMAAKSELKSLFTREPQNIEDNQDSHSQSTFINYVAKNTDWDDNWEAIKSVNPVICRPTFVDGDDDIKAGLQRTNSTPFKEINDKTRLVSSNSVPGSGQLISENFLRKRFCHDEDSDESENNEIKHLFSPITDHSDSGNPNINDSNSNDVNISTKPNLMRQRSLRRRVSVLGPHIFTQAERLLEESVDQRLWKCRTTSSSLLRRTGSVLVSSPIFENVDNDDIDKDDYHRGDISFGEQSLSKALDSVRSSRLSDRPKIVSRRRSQIQKRP